MIWIYGGAFIMGEANREWFGPDYFMKEDVVLVTLQYRVGALGKGKLIRFCVTELILISLFMQVF